MLRATAIGRLLLLFLAGSLPALADHWQATPLPVTGLKAGDQFGAAVAVAPNVIAVGAHAAGRGEVYLYRRVDGNWVAFPGPPLREEGVSRFGFDVAFDAEGTKLLVGAPGTGCGRVFLYEIAAADGRVEGTTLPELPPGACRSGDEVGSAVAIGSGGRSGTVLAVGARGAERTGLVYVSIAGGRFDPIEAPGLVARSELGQSLAVSGDLLVAGAPAPYASTGEEGDTIVVDLARGERPLKAEKLPLPAGLRAGAAFGYAVAAAGDLIAVGAPLHNDGAGALFRYRRNVADGRWKLEADPVATGAARDQLGVAVAFGDGRLVAGARYAGTARAGAAYLYGHGELRSPLPRAGAEFGFAVGLHGDTAVVGAFRQEGTGAAFVFEPVHLPVVRLDAVTDEILDNCPGTGCGVADVREGRGPVRLRVSASGAPLAAEVRVRVASAAGTAGAAADCGRPAADGSEDYCALSEVVVLTPAQPSTTVEADLISDGVCEAAETFTVALSGPANAMLDNASSSVLVRILNDNAGSILLTPGALTTSEDGTPVPFQVRLDCPPAGNVTVALAASPALASFDRPLLTFTPTNWHVPQTVTARGTDDAACLPAASKYAITASSASTDPSYALATIQASNTNDDVTCVSGTKKVCPAADGTVVYTIVLANDGSAAMEDLASHELLEALPPQLSVVLASATRGVATVDYAGDAVTWNGRIPEEGVVTITIVAALHEVAEGTEVSNHARLTFDREGDGGPEIAKTDADPATGGPEDPTCFKVGDVCPPALPCSD
jgi:FG-GAP repeat/Calx-beta domain